MYFSGHGDGPLINSTPRKKGRGRAIWRFRKLRGARAFLCARNETRARRQPGRYVADFVSRRGKIKINRGSPISAAYGESVAGSVASAPAIPHRSLRSDFLKKLLSEVHQIEAGGAICTHDMEKVLATYPNSPSTPPVVNVHVTPIDLRYAQTRIIESTRETCPDCGSALSRDIPEYK